MKTLLRLTFMVAVLLATALSASADVYLAGEFNNWTAGDANYKFTNVDGGTKYALYVDASNIVGKSFKITYGDWDWGSIGSQLLDDNNGLTVDAEGNAVFPSDLDWKICHYLQ